MAIAEKQGLFRLPGGLDASWATIGAVTTAGCSYAQSNRRTRLSLAERARFFWSGTFEQEGVSESDAVKFAEYVYATGIAVIKKTKPGATLA